MLAMETTFYEDERRYNMGKHKIDNSLNRNGDISDLKRKMTLDFNAAASKKQKISNLLTSPDLNMLKLASPELERMIISQHGLITTTTPTPTQFIFPKNVTEEQEQYAKGFVEALEQLKSSYPSANIVTSSGNACDYIELSQIPSALSASPSSNDSLATTVSMPVGQTVTVPFSRVQHIKDEPQIVPCLGATPPVSPVNMADQERIKLERKRERNRLAATKCRQRKLERISELEKKVAELKGQNTTLSTTASKLKEQVCDLKKTLLEHMNHGCKIVLPTDLSV